MLQTSKALDLDQTFTLTQRLCPSAADCSCSDFCQDETKLNLSEIFLRPTGSDAGLKRKLGKKDHVT